MQTPPQNPPDGFSIAPLGDTAITLTLADEITPHAAATVARTSQLLEQARTADSLPGITEMVRAYCSITLFIDPVQTTLEAASDAVRYCLNDSRPATTPATTRWRLPACYDATHAPDLEDVATQTGLSPAEIVNLHVDGDFLVYMIGFLPGFPFMGDLDPRLKVPRRTSPRTRVPPGSIAITGLQTAIYPWESPGGWSLIGHCPVTLFNADWSRPALLSAGDSVSFEAISKTDADKLRADLEAGRKSPHDFQEACA